MSRRMPTPDVSPVSLADLDAAGVWLRTAEAATIVHQLLLQVSRGDLPGVPSAHVVRLGSEGGVHVEGPVAAGGRGVSRAAELLDVLLPGLDAPPERHVPDAMRLIIRHGLGVLDPTRYPSLESFGEALAPFSGWNPEAVVKDVFARAIEIRGAVAARQAPASAAGGEETASVRRLDTRRADPVVESGEHAPGPSLTISDIRRARRATGLTLAEVAGRSRMPQWMLLELEWGYFRNWPPGPYGRTQLVRYARASGLDEQVVVRTVWPLLEREPRIPAIPPVHDAAYAVSKQDRRTAVAAATPSMHAAHAAMSRRSRVLAALAIPALLAVGLAPAMWNRTSTPELPSRPRMLAAQESPARQAPVPLASSSQSGPSVPSGASAAPGTAAAAATRQISADARIAADPRPERVLPDAAVYSPAFAAAGSAMFYHADSGDDSRLMRADTDSSGAVLRVTSIVDDDARNFHARPSPDGARIAFDSDREGERAVYIADANGENVRRVSGPGFAAIPSWSPDGRTLAYVRAEPDRPRVWNLWTKALESGEERRLTSFRVGQPWGASWFPDGRRIAFSHETRLIIQDLATAGERVFASPIRGRLVRTPAVSPDGRRILFQVYRDGAWLLDVADGSMRRVLSDPSAEEYSWAPDGRRVAYHSRQSGTWGVWVMASR